VVREWRGVILWRASIAFDFHHRPMGRGESALAIVIDQSRWQGFIDSLLTLYDNLVTFAMCDPATS
jgi:hypothetical protein